MRKIIVVVWFLIAMYWSTTSIWAAEEGWSELSIENGGFEEEVTDSSVVPKWDYWSGGYKTGLSVTDEFTYDGDQSLKIHNDGVVGLFSQSIPVNSGKEYKLNAKLYVEETEGKPGIWLRWIDKNGSIIANTPKYFEISNFNQWENVSIQAQAPDQAESVKVFIYQSSTAFTDGYYDDIKLFEKESDELETPFEYGDPLNLGPAVLAAQGQGTAVGEDEVYYGTNGSPATFYATDKETGEVIFSESLPGSDVIWGMTIGSDGNVYFSGTYNGILYRYNVEEQKLESLGQNPSDNWVWQLDASEDGKIFGVTYPNAKVFEYDFDNEAFTDLGRFHDTEKYARGLGVTEDYLYVGIGTKAHLMRMDRQTGETTEIELPITGDTTSVSNIWSINGNLFIAYGTSLLVIDEETFEVNNHITYDAENAFDGIISEPSPYNENLVYYRNKQTGEFMEYNLETHEVSAVQTTGNLPSSPAKGASWVKNEDGDYVLGVMHYQIEYTEFNPKTNEVSVSYPDVEESGLQIQSLEIGNDQNVYMGGYQGSFGVFDTEKESYLLQERNPHQIEGIGFMNGKVYLGTYGGARIYEYNPEEPYQYDGGSNGDNPYLAYTIPNDQSRPFTLTSGDHKLFVGTIPDYGTLGGSLAVYDEKTDEWTSHANMVENQSIIGLAYKDGTLFGGSSIYGGLGIDPSEINAKMFSFDTESESYETFTLDIQGFTNFEMIGELSFGPDGNLWGAAWGYNQEGSAQSVIFAMNPDTQEVIKSKALYEGAHRGSTWRPFYLRWDADGNLYTTVARKLTIMDPETMKYKQLLSSNVNLMDLDQEGNIYYASGDQLFKLPVPVENVELDFETSNVLQGEQVDANLTVHLVNGQTANLEGAKLEWHSSNESIASIEDGKLTAHNAGDVSVYATVTYNGTVVESNKFNMSINVTLDTFRTQINETITTTALKQKLLTSLNVAEKLYNQELINQGNKHLDEVVKHIENSGLKSNWKDTLIQNVNSIKSSY